MKLFATDGGQVALKRQQTVMQKRQFHSPAPELSRRYVTDELPTSEPHWIQNPVTNAINETTVADDPLQASGSNEAAETPPSPNAWQTGDGLRLHSLFEDAANDQPTGGGGQSSCAECEYSGYWCFGQSSCIGVRPG